MKTFFLHQLRNIAAIAIVGVIVYGAYLAKSPVFIPQQVEAGASQNVDGWVWSAGTGSGSSDLPSGPYSAETGASTGLGWISLNSTSDSSGVSYGVNISPVAASGNGNFSGYAWSENAGWISFDRTTAGNPPSAPFNGGSGPIAQVDWSTGKVTGWARQLSNADGWIKFSDDAIPSWNGRGVKINTTTGKFSGYAWGSEMFGWIDFAPTVGGSPMPEDDQAKVVISATCDVSNPTLIWGSCDASLSCVNGGESIQYNLAGVRFGTCTDGSSGTPVEACVAASTSCVRSATIYIVGDGFCDAALGENSTNSLADCKPKTKFWQF